MLIGSLDGFPYVSFAGGPSEKAKHIQIINRPVVLLMTWIFATAVGFP